MMETLGLYNFLPYGYLSTGAASLMCKLFDGKLCDLVMALVADEDPTIDYTERYDVYTSNLPAGASYRNIVHYAQLIDLPYEEFLRWDYESAAENQKHYGQPTPPAYDLSLLDFPLAILGGQQDQMADPEDVEWTAGQLKNTTIFYHQYYLGHMSFAIAKDMSWFDVDVLAILNHYNAKCDEKTLNSNFEAGNDLCKEKLGLTNFM